MEEGSVDGMASWDDEGTNTRRWTLETVETSPTRLARVPRRILGNQSVVRNRKQEGREMVGGA